MKRFLITISCFFCIPVILIIGIYMWTDPFRCLHPFDLENISAVNREYLSTELYLQNRDSIHYNSFIFSSSRGCGLNTYQWKQYLNEDAKPFLFQAWSETVTGEYQKLKFLDESGVQIDNAILMFDIPGSFSKTQKSHNALDLKHFLFTGSNKFTYNVSQFYNFIQKPSFWLSSIKTRNNRDPYFSDRITNDFDAINRNDFKQLPPQDSLKSCSLVAKNKLLSQVNNASINDIVTSEPLINDDLETILKDIKTILNKHHTNYVIIISPAICYTNPTINPHDLQILKQIFGKDKVYNYTGANNYTTDINNFTDPNHFGRRVGFQIIQEIYDTIH